MEEIKSLVKAEHASWLLSGVSSLRKDNISFIPDFSIKVEEKSIPVHRAVLAATSGYFHAMFSHDVQEVDKGFVDMKDVTFDAIEKSMEFAYTGEADVTMGNVKSVAFAAELLQFRGLNKLCSNYLGFNLDEENCLSVKALADMYNWDELKVLAEKFVIQHFKALISTESYAQLDISDLVLYLKASEVDHKVLWRAIITWVSKVPERDNQLLCLMETIHLEEFPFSYTINTILQEPLVTKSTSAKKFAVSSLFCDQAKLESNVSLDNCFILHDLVSNSENSDVEDAKRGIRKFMMGNLDEISSRSEFLNLAHEELKLFFESSETRCSSEMSKLTALFQWTKHKGERKEFFPHLFSLADLGQLQFNFLRNMLKEEPLLKEFPDCMERLHQEFGVTSTEFRNESLSNDPKRFAILDQLTGVLLPSTKSISASQVQEWMAQVASQESTHQIFNIGPEGKEITISGYRVCFQRNVFEVETDIKLPVIANPRGLPPNMDPLAPALDFTGIPRLQTAIQVQRQGGMLLQKLPGGKWKRTRIAKLGAGIVPIFAIQQPCFIISVARDRDFKNEWWNMVEHGVIKREFAQKIKEKTKITQTIDPKGGDVIIHGCSLNFIPNAVKKEEEITVSMDNNPENYPPNRMAIAPILGFKPSMKFDKPVTVKMQTWYSALEGETIPAILSSRKHGSDWKDVGEVILGSTNEVKFTVTHFCEISLGVAPQHSNIGNYTLFNDIYIQRSTAVVHSCSFLDRKSEAEFRGIMRGKNCATFSTKTLQICGKLDQKVSLKLDISEPQRKESLKQEFQIQKVFKSRSYHLQFDPNLELKYYDGLVKGKFSARVDEQEEDNAILAREWPITLDPPGPPIIQNIAAGMMVDGQSQVTYTAADANIDVRAVSP